MITWVTVWVLTVVFDETGSNGYVRRDSYQLQYATQAICEKQRKNHVQYGKTTRCDFQQVPVVKK